jgi:thiosulfate dehydrogenase
MRGPIITLALLAGAGAVAVAASPRPKHGLPAPRAGGTVVGLCDGETSTEIRALKPGEELSRKEAQGVSDRLMLEWRKKHPEVGWDPPLVAQNARPSGEVGHGAGTTPSNTPPPAGAPGSPAASQTGVYSGYTSRDEMVWHTETDKFVQEGNRVFHDAKQLGGTIGISCDMCHPNGANTHPETYPKFQVQLGRVALLRDMINWCLENPVKARPMSDDDDRLRAMEAYIYAQRKGVKLDFGRH